MERIENSVKQWIIKMFNEDILGNMNSSQQARYDISGVRSSYFNEEAPIIEICLAPWCDLIATAEGFYLYARSITTVGQISLYLTVRDADQTNFTFLVGTLEVLPSGEFLAISGGTSIMLLLMVGICILILWWQRSHPRRKVQRIVKRIKKIIGVR